jgi:hypothetical protein
MNHSPFPCVQSNVVLRGTPRSPGRNFGIFSEGIMMSGNTRQIFHGITRAIFARLSKKASKIGIRVATPNGEAEKDGITIQWNYDAKAELLEVECRAPFWINSTRINRDLRHEIEATRRSSRAA